MSDETPDENPPAVADDESPPSLPLTEEEKDRFTLAALEAEYAEVKASCEHAVKFGESHKPLLARKGDVFREITALKRKYRLP